MAYGHHKFAIIKAESELQIIFFLEISDIPAIGLRTMGRVPDGYEYSSGLQSFDWLSSFDRDQSSSLSITFAIRHRDAFASVIRLFKDLVKAHAYSLIPS